MRPMRIAMYSCRQWHMSDLYSRIEINDAVDLETSPGNNNISVMARQEGVNTVFWAVWKVQNLVVVANTIL